MAANLNAAEEALEAYQREKQQRLNELLVVIPLKLHQVTQHHWGRNGVTPKLFQRQIHGSPVLYMSLGGRILPACRVTSLTLPTHSDY